MIHLLFTNQPLLHSSRCGDLRSELEDFQPEPGPTVAAFLHQFPRSVRHPRITGAAFSSQHLTVQAFSQLIVTPPAALAFYLKFP